MILFILACIFVILALLSFLMDLGVAELIFCACAFLTLIIGCIWSSFNPNYYQGKTMDNKIVNFTSHDQHYRDRTTITVDGRTYKLKEYWKVEK